LAARIAEVQKYKDLYAELSEQVSELEGTIADRDFRVLDLEQQIQTLRSDLSSASSEQVAKGTELKNLYISKEASLSARLHELERTVGQHEEAMQLLSTEKANCLEQLDTAQRQLQQAEEALTRYSKRITLSEEEAKHLRADLERAGLELGQQEDQARLLRTESEAHKTRVSDLREALARREAELASLTLQLEESLSQRTLLAEQCASKEASLSMSQASLVHLQARATSFDLTLAERNSKVVELTENLADVGAENLGLRDNITSLEAAVGNLRNDLDGATSRYSELDMAYQLKCDECNNLSTRIQEVEGNVANLSGVLSKAKDDAEALSQSLERARDGESTWRDASRQAEALHQEHVGTLSAEVKQLRAALSMSELNANGYMEKSTENQLEITHLRKQLAEAQGGIQEVEHALHVAEVQYSAERATHESTATAMEESLAATRQEIDSLSLQMRSAHATHSKLQDELHAQTQELSEVRASLHAECQRATTLKAELAAAVSRASDAEEDILGLRSSKQADERTIDLLRESFAKLREVQMQSLADLDVKVVAPFIDPNVLLTEFCKGTLCSFDPSFETTPQCMT
jgi:chromosome segregation ATPase